MENFIDICEKAAKAGGRVLQDWVGRFEAREKGPADMVTDADLASQSEIRQIVLGAYPDHAFLGEEGPPAGNAGSDYRWLVDPLDGTTNYVHQIPQYCVSIALEHRGEMICGAVFDPVANESFTATRGGGAFLNGRRIRVSRTTELSQAVVVVSFPPHIKAGGPELSEFARVAVASRGIRRTGSAALNLCYLAMGRFDGYWSGKLKPWDVAAGALLVQEAGGTITTGNGKPFQVDQQKFVAASTLSLHGQLMELVGDV